MATTSELYDRLDEMDIDETMKQDLCNYFSSSQLEGFVEFLEEERGYK